MKVSNIKEAEKILKDKGIKVIPGHVYIFYSCGCVVDACDDPFLRTYSPKTRRSRRCCPKCEDPGYVVTKYKKCSTCGTAHINKHLGQGSSCIACWRRTPQRTGRKYGPVGMPKGWKNGKFADNERRASCLHRNACLEKYDRFQAVPCKGCRDYVHMDIMQDVCVQGEFGYCHDVEYLEG